MEYIIEMCNITKEFPGIIANDDITLQLKKGEIHALLGENGAGKSTLMSVLFGMYQPEKGCIKMNGEVVSINNPNDANRLIDVLLLHAGGDSQRRIIGNQIGVNGIAQTVFLTHLLKQQRGGVLSKHRICNTQCIIIRIIDCCICKPYHHNAALRNVSVFGFSFIVQLILYLIKGFYFLLTSRKG